MGITTQNIPPPTRIDTVIDIVHGQQIVDPYRWLEDGNSLETKVWVEAQNAYTRAQLDALPYRPAIRARLAELLSIGTVQPPSVRAGRYFYTRRQGDENQPRLYVRAGLHGEDRVLLDPNTVNAEGTIALDWWYPSWDGHYVAYGYSTHGDERSTLYVVDVATGQHLSDVIPHTRYTSLGWLPDSSGFFYTRYPDPASGEIPVGEEYYHRAVYLHKLGTEPQADQEIYPDDNNPQTVPQISLSEDGRWLLLTIHTGWDRADVYVRDLHAPESTFMPIAVGLESLFDGIIVNERLYLRTNLDAPRYRLLAIDLTRPAREHWLELIPERDDAVLENICIAGDRIIAHYLHNASSQLISYRRDGSDGQSISLPMLGSVTGITGLASNDEAFFGFESFTLAPTIYRYDTGSGQVEEWERVTTPFDPSAYKTQQVWYKSKDETRVSMFLVHKPGMQRTGTTPTLLTGYGGFNISRTPLFNRSLILWLEQGGLYALPNLRGGGEYGEEWHRAGKLANKQNVFDDFIAAAEFLIHERYTSPEHLAIVGRSNGGLLVGAALTQRPDLFRAVICSVPLLDMVRYHHFLIARLWIPEYGSAEEPEQFRYLLAYSPYHQVIDGTSYPAVLLTTGASDSRVDPMHARKMAARLQAATASPHPILLRIEFEAGHGIGKPLQKLLEEETDIWSFLFWQLGIRYQL
jgi:prolyl oligopeptidase